MNEYLFAEFVIGNIHYRNKISNIKEFKLNGANTECYRSIFLFDFKLEEYVSKTGSVSGYMGKHIADALVFDFDGDDLETVRREVVKFCGYLSYALEVPVEYIRVAFSGNKGFHVAIPFKAVSETLEARDDFYKVYKAIAEELVQGFSFADKSIYEPRRILRILNTINGKTGLYKIPLTIEELEKLEITEIKKLAESSRIVENLPVGEIAEVESLNEIYRKHESRDFIKSQFDSDQHLQQQQGKRSEILSIIKNGASEGNRHLALVRITDLFVKQGFDYEYSLEMLRLWNTRNNPPLPAKRLEDESFRIFQDARKKIIGNVTSETEIYSLRQAEAKYQEYIAVSEKAKVNIGYGAIDKKLRGIMPGEVMCILGKTSVGKSAFLQNVGLKYAKTSKEPTLFYSMEMPITSVFERAMQIETGLSGSEVERLYKENSNEITVKANLMFNDIPNFFSITKGELNLEQIKSLTLFAENNIYRKKTGLILIDYLGLIKAEGGSDDLYTQVSRNARGIKDLAKALNVPIIYLSQVTKKFSEFDELEINSARDSGCVDEASDYILALWKEKELKSDQASQNEFRLKLGILKNRKGGTGKISIRMQKKDLKIEEI